MRVKSEKYGENNNRLSEWNKRQFLSYVKWEKENTPKFKNKRVTYENALELLMAVTDGAIGSGMNYDE